ncbi:MAG: GspJ family T2SS minor pseudopilin variant XcpW [Wenzhouxiangellaceae bacterium]
MNTFDPVRLRGFTLIEVLIAIMVFALLASIAYASLDTLSRTAQVLRTRGTEFAELQRAVAAMDADLRQLVTRMGRDRQGRTLPVLMGDQSSLVARRAGRFNPSGLPRSQLQQFRWRNDGAALVRETWPDVIADPSDPPVARRRYDTLRLLRMRYLDADGRWHPVWPAAGATDTLPRAIEYHIESARYGELRRLVVL